MILDVMFISGCRDALIPELERAEVNPDVSHSYFLIFHLIYRSLYRRKWRRLL